MADRVVKLKLEVETQGAVAGFRNVSAAAKDFGSKAGQYIDKNRDSINTLSNTVGGFGLAAVGAVGLAVKQFADFDAKMSEVQAATGETAANMAELRQAALDAGASTVYSASEAAAAITELGKAGLSTDAILSGGLAGALDLAASEGMAVAEAAELTATALTQFALSGDKAAHVADLLAAGAGKAQGSAADLGMALKQGGLVANQFGLTIEETAGGLALFAKQGLIGSDAGTSLKSMLTALANPSKETVRLMDELGISAYDATGQFIGLDGLAGVLQDTLGGLTDAQRQQALAQIFGTDAMRAASVLYSEGADGVREMTAAVNDQGYAAEAAATRLDNLKGDLEGFGGAVETLMISAGEGANGPLRSLVQGATDVVNAFSDLPDPIKQGTLLLVGSAGLTALGIAGLGKMAIAVRDVQKAVQAMGMTMKGASLAAGGIGLALVGVTAGIMAMAGESQRAKERVENLSATLDELGQATAGTGEAMVKAWQDRQGWVSGLDGERRSVLDIAAAYGYTTDQLLEMASGSEEGEAALAALVERQREAKQASSELNGVRGAEDRQVAYDREARALDDLIKGVTDQRDALTEAERQKKADTEASVAAGAAQEALRKAMEPATASIIDQTKALEGQWEALTEVAEAALSARDAQRGFESAIDAAAEALKDNGKTLDITTEKGRENQAALDQVASAGLRMTDSMRKNGATQDELQGAMQRTRDEFVRVAQSMGMGADEANALADELNLIPTAVRTQVDVTGAEEAMRRAQAVYDAIKNLPTAKYITVGVIDHYSRNAAAIYSATGGNGGRPFATGGYTGPGAKYEPAGVVHRGEYVMTAEATRRIGVAQLDNLNYGQVPGYAGGGQVGSSSPSVSIVAPQAVTRSDLAYLADRIVGALRPRAVEQNSRLQHAAEIGVS